MTEDWQAARLKVWFSAALRAFTVTLWVITLIAAGVAVDQIARANAMGDCKHRGYAHIDHHGGKAEDDRFHLMHHELPTCDHDKHEGKADEAENEVHEAEHSEHKLKSLEPHVHHHDKLGPHEHHLGKHRL
jgi:hypothetical protein